MAITKSEGENMYEYEKFLLLRDLDDKLVEVLKENGAMIVGGAIRSVFTGDKINDYDIFFKSEEDLQTVYHYLSGLKKEYKDMSMTSNAYSFFRKKNKTRIQLIRVFIFKDVNDIFGKFDFTVCMGAYDVSHSEFIFGERFFRDNSSKRLVINLETEYPLNTMLRIRKYLKKGYRITGMEMVKLGLAVNNLKIENHADLQHHLMGIDTMILQDFFDQNGEKVDDVILKQTEYNFSEIIDKLNAQVSRYYSDFLGDDEDY